MADNCFASLFLVYKHAGSGGARPRRTHHAPVHTEPTMEVHDRFINKKNGRAGNIPLCKVVLWGEWIMVALFPTSIPIHSFHPQWHLDYEGCWGYPFAWVCQLLVKGRLARSSCVFEDSKAGSIGKFVRTTLVLCLHSTTSHLLFWVS